MTQHTRPQEWVDSDSELRRTNRATVERYLDMTEGPARLQRHHLFTEDARGGLWTTDTGQPAAVTGRENLYLMAAWSLECFPDWRWTNVEIYETQDPNRMWVECDEEDRSSSPTISRATTATTSSTRSASTTE